MKIRHLLPLLFLCCFTAQADVQKNIATTPKSIIVTKSSRVFTITLESNPTTGFSWFLQNYDSKLIKPKKHAYIAPQNKKMIGAPGQETFTFDVKKDAFKVPHILKIHFMYARPWTPEGASEKTFTIVTK